MQDIFCITISFMLGAYSAFSFVGWRLRKVMTKEEKIEFLKKFKGRR